MVSFPSWKLLLFLNHFLVLCCIRLSYICGPGPASAGGRADGTQPLNSTPSHSTQGCCKSIIAVIVMVVVGHGRLWWMRHNVRHKRDNYDFILCHQPLHGLLDNFFPAHFIESYKLTHIQDDVISLKMKVNALIWQLMCSPVRMSATRIALRCNTLYSSCTECPHNLVSLNEK